MDNIVDASPVKSFFVQMLTRDIELSDAILDLLDNCIDGILRTAEPASSNPYEGRKIEIALSANEFMITDNCGGIPLEILKTYAFRMGRVPTMPKDDVTTVGTFGIGMKRAIFKMGSRCEVLTKSKADFHNGDKKAYKVEITPDWIANESEWNIPLSEVHETELGDFGTIIHVSELNKSTSVNFDCQESGFAEKIKKQISITYGVMITKGLVIMVNGEIVKSAPLALKFGKDVAPFVYKTKIDDVEVFLAIGLTSPPIDGDGTPEDGGPSKYSAQCAGWTILCNDRVVLYSDKTILTGWGEAGVPQFHPQYNPISGIVAFNSRNVRALPTTTTKRGVDASNPTYLLVKNFMRDGVKACIKFTNDWKTREAEIKERINAVQSIPFQILKEKPSEYVQTKPNKSANKGFVGEIAKAILPVPEQRDSTKINCSVMVEQTHIQKVASFLNISASPPRNVVLQAFNRVYEEAIDE